MSWGRRGGGGAAAGAEFVGRSLTLISSGLCKWATIFNYVSVLMVRHIWSHASLGKYVKNDGFFFLLLGSRNCLVLNSNAPFYVGPHLLVRCVKDFNRISSTTRRKR